MGLKQKTELILKGNMYKVIIVLAVPIMLNNLIQTLYNLTDTYFLSRLGTRQMAAMTLGWPVVFLVLGIGVGFAVAGSTLISQYIGSGNIKMARKYAGQVVFSGMTFSLILAILGTLSLPLILNWMGASGELYKEAKTYLTIIIAGTPLVYGSIIYNAIKQGQGDTISPMIVSLCSVGANIILDPLFIFHFHMGIAGAGFATLISRGGILFFIVYKIFFQDSPLKLSLKELKPNFEYIKVILKVGIPASISQGMISFGFIVLNSIVNSYGEVTLAAMGIGNRVNGLFTMPIMGIGGAVSSIVGQNIGNNNVKRVHECFRKSVILSILLTIPVTVILLKYGSFIIEGFSKDKDIISLGSEYLNYITLSFLALGIFGIIGGIFQGSGRTKLAMVLTISRLWALRVPMLFILPLFIGRTPHVIWYSVFASNILAMVLCYIVYKNIKFKSII